MRYFQKLSEQAMDFNEVYFSRKSVHPFHYRSKVLGLGMPPIPHFRPHRLSFLIEAEWYKRFQASDFDVVHPIEYGLSPTGQHFIDRGASLVITVYDLIHEKFGAPGNLYDKQGRTSFYKKANGLIFISESTRRDFNSFYPELTESIPNEVVYLGNNFVQSGEVVLERKAQFLFVGSRSGYKNFENACKAFELLSEKFKDVKFIVAGPPPSKIDRKVSSGIRKIEWVTKPSDMELARLFSSSLGLLYVSRYEGFGLPPLEAMSLGCVPIAGNHSSIPEVLGDAGIMLQDVSDPRLICNSMENLLADEAFRKERVVAGIERSRHFDWKIAQNKTLSLYRKSIRFKRDT